MAFYKVGRLSEIEPGGACLVEAGDREIALFKVDGELYAIDDCCSHEEGSLSQGELIGHEVECPVHGARFDVRTGEVTEEPAVLQVDTFAVRVNGDEIEIDI
jgi:3-phenylpropionate/trans-cinnamate dioxygenase ferredoxin subunit